MALLGATVFALVMAAMMTWWFASKMRVETPFSQKFNLTGFMPLPYTVFTLALVLAVGALS